MSYIDKLSTELDMDQVVANAGNSRFTLVLIAAARAREIENTRLIATRADGAKRWRNKSISAALQEIEAGTIGPDYLDKVHKNRK